MIRPRRTLLFAPANRPALQEKALATGADIVCIDLEDAIPSSEKESARALAVPFLTNAPGAERVLRINSIRSADGLRDMLAVIAARPAGGTIMLPKVATADEVRLVDDLLTEAALPLSLSVLIESAEGLENARAIMAASPRITFALFGAVDFSSEMGVPVAHEPLLYPRSRLVHAAKLAGIDILDVPCLAFRDDAVVKAEAETALTLGFTGKAALHPANVATIKAAYTPTPEQIARAEKIVALYEASPNGLAELDGKLIEKPVIRAMQRILAFRV
ncbi:MAG: CoA ester lyase [Rhodobacterales bacterium]|nr:CoA ester lyase [Rhodobacterales bacterium]